MTVLDLSLACASVHIGGGGILGMGGRQGYVSNSKEKGKTTLILLFL